MRPIHVMNFAAADAASWRSVVAYTAAPVFLAIITDRVISVIRRHVLPLDTESAWAWLGQFTVRCLRLYAVVVLYGLRTVLAPRSTLSGLRRMVLDAAPVPGLIELEPVDCADPEIAIRTASALAGPAEGDGDMRFWLEKSVFAIAALLHAAALLGEDMSAVWRWSQRLGDPMQDAMGCPGASRELLAAALEIYKDTKSADSIRMTMGRSLAWVGVPGPARFGLGPGGRAVRRGQLDELRRDPVRDQLG